MVEQGRLTEYRTDPRPLEPVRILQVGGARRHEPPTPAPEAGRPALAWEYASTVRAASLQVTDHPPDLLLWILPPDARAGDLSRVVARYPDLPIVFVTPEGDLDLAGAALQAGAQDCLPASSLEGPALDERLALAVRRKQHERSQGRQAARTQALLEAVPDLIVRLSRDGTILDYKPAVNFPTYVSPEEFLGQNLRAVMPAEVTRKSLAAIRETLESGQIQVFTYQLLVASEPHHYECRLVASGHEEVIAIVRDITNQELAQQREARFVERLRILRNIDRAILASLSPEAIIKATLAHIQVLVPCQRGSIAVFDQKSNRVTVFATYANNRVQQGTGTLLSPETFGDLDLLRRDHVQVVQDLEGATGLPPDIAVLREEGVRAYIRAPLTSNGDLIGALSLESFDPEVFTAEHVAIAREIADPLAIAIRQANLFDRIRYLAITDELTGLYNRRHFFELAHREFERVQRYGGALSVIMVDLDQFKQVNDSHGHQTGDRVLRHIAATMQASIREADILSRYGGDEFVLLLPETDLPSARLLAERLQHKIATAPLMTRGGTIGVTATLGVASLDTGVSDLATLIGNADADMFATKPDR